MPNITMPTLPGTLVTIRGEARRDDDPKFDPWRENSRIWRRCRVDEVGDVVARWLAMGRTINGIDYR
jgi:hypothetical protein